MSYIKYYKENLKLSFESADERKQIYSELNELKKYIADLADDLYKREQEKKRQEILSAMRGLPAGGTVFYLRNGNDMHYGDPLTKVKDGRTRMHIRTSEGKEWLVYYSNLSLEKPSDVNIRLNKMLSEK